MDVTKHIEWARSIARRVSREAGFVGHDADADLEAEALLVLCERAAAFSPAGPVDDPGRAFRGYAYQRIYRRVQQFGMRLRNGGLYHTKRPTTRVPAAVSMSLLMRHLIPVPGVFNTPDAFDWDAG